MRYRLAVLSFSLVAVLTNGCGRASAQVVNVEVSADTSGARTANLAFSKDGRLLREIQNVSDASLGNFSYVRAITYDATNGSISHSLSLEPHTGFLFATTDGRTAIILADGDWEGARVLLVDMETGQAQDVPSEWFDSDDHNPYAQISGDGQLVSAYTTTGAADGPLVVSVYNWRTKKLVGKRATGYPAGGISWGGVTVDGKIEFLNNRVGGDIVEPKTGKLIIRVGPNSYRSPNGAWDIEFPHPMFPEGAKGIIIVNGGSGKEAGMLDLPIAGNEEKWAWARGAFCGTSGRFIAAIAESVQAFEIPSGKKLADFPVSSWRDEDAMKTDPTVAIACSADGKRVAIRSGARLTLHHLK